MELYGLLGVLLILLVSVGVIVSKVYGRKKDVVHPMSPEEFNDFLDTHRKIITKCLQAKVKGNKENG